MEIKMKELKVGERITLEVVERPDVKGVIFLKVKKQKRNMKENKHSLKISRSLFGDITLDGYPIGTYSNNELKILKNLLTKVLNEVNEYIHL